MRRTVGEQADTGRPPTIRKDHKGHKEDFLQKATARAQPRDDLQIAVGCYLTLLRSFAAIPFCCLLFAALREIFSVRCFVIGLQAPIHT
jgi:hypothetical protein